MRVQLAGDDSEVEVRLGGDHAELFRSALRTLDEKRQTPLGQHVNYIVMIPGKAPVFGYPASLHPSAAGGAFEARDDAAAPRPPRQPSSRAASRGARAEEAAPRRRRLTRGRFGRYAPRWAVLERRVV